MNEKLENLAIKSGFKPDDMPDMYYKPMNIFADLILKECQDILQPELSGMITRKVAVDLIKESFK